MKHIKTIIASIITIVLLVVFMPVSQVVNATSRISTIDYRVTVEAILKDFVGDETRQNRFACSENEYNAAVYIAGKMTEYGFTPVNNQSTKNGFQEFDVKTEEGLYSSRNVIFKKDGTKTDKKIILATHYDTDYIYEASEDGKNLLKVGSEGVSDSGAGVASLLLLSQVLAYETLDYTVEVVFFGSHYQNLAGSAYYTSFISAKESENIMLMVNFDHLIGDGSVYVYNGEFENKTDNYVFSAFTKNLNARNFADYSIISDTQSKSVTGLNYTNFAMESDNAHFMRIGVKTFSPIVVNNSMVSALNTIDYRPLVAIKEDTINKVNTLTNGKYLANLSLVINGCVNLLTDANFKIEMTKASLSKSYGFWSNEKMFVFIAFVLFILIIFVYVIIKQQLERKAIEARETLNLDKIIATINPADLEDMDSLMDRLTAQFEEDAKREEEKNKKAQTENKEEIKEKIEESKQEKEDDNKKSE